MHLLTSIFALLCSAVLFTAFAPQISMAQSTYRGPVSRITSGFGADGTFAIDTLFFPASGWEGSGMTRNVEVYYPRGTTSPRPTLLFAHGFGGNDPRFYGELLRNVVSRGYTAVFVPYPISINTAALYRTMDSGFAEAVRRFPNVIDSTRIGFAGHSFGAGAIPSIAHKAFTQRGWGGRGRFLFPMAPWYALETTQEQLRSFPSDTKLLMQIYADDATNDHRLAMDIFLNIAIPDAEKDFITVFADTVQNYVYSAGHSLCTVNTPAGGAFDAYDYYAVFRPLDALMQYTFNPANTVAKNVALGNGSAEQVFMGSLAGRAIKPMSATDRPKPLASAPRTTFSCDNATNPRRSYCSLQITSVMQTAPTFAARITPQPASDGAALALSLTSAHTLVVTVVDVLGAPRLTLAPKALHTGAHEIPLSLENLPSGVYFCRFLLDGAPQQTLPFLVQR